MKFNDLEFQPIILGADITAYSLARSFHEQYGIKSITLSMTQTGYVNISDIIENRYYPNMEKDEVAVERLIEVGKEFQGKKKLIVFGCGDWYVRIIIENKEKLKQAVVFYHHCSKKINCRTGIAYLLKKASAVCGPVYACCSVKFKKSLLRYQQKYKAHKGSACIVH